MLTIQGECSALVVEIRHPIGSIVADQTVLAELLNMLEDEFGVLPGVAIFTFRIGYREVAFNRMAGCTRYGISVEIYLVPDQAELRSGVIEISVSVVRRVELPSAVVGVTVGTAVDALDEVVGAIIHHDLPVDILVACQA